MTVVQLVESGFDALSVSDDERAGMYAGHSQGWTRELGELVDHAAGVVA